MNFTESQKKKENDVTWTRTEIIRNLLLAQEINRSDPSEAKFIKHECFVQ